MRRCRALALPADCHAAHSPTALVASPHLHHSSHFPVCGPLSELCVTLLQGGDMVSTAVASLAERHDAAMRVREQQLRAEADDEVEQVAPSA